MLSAVLAVFVGMVLAVILSYRKNKRAVAQGRGYKPAPGLIGWGDSAPPAQGAAQHGADG